MFCPPYQMYGTAIIVPSMLVNNAVPVNAMKIIARGMLTSVKQHSSSQEFRHSLVRSS